MRPSVRAGGLRTDRSLGGLHGAPAPIQTAGDLALVAPAVRRAVREVCLRHQQDRYLQQPQGLLALGVGRHSAYVCVRLLPYDLRQTRR
eukprot:scaffold7225_cov379-Prasinococcus_capsulatus_cf.AAC.6